MTVPVCPYHGIVSYVQFEGNLQGAVVVSGIHTDFVFTEFSDRWFIILSQFEKLGTLVGIIFFCYVV